MRLMVTLATTAALLYPAISFGEWTLYYITDTHMTETWAAEAAATYFCNVVNADTNAVAVLHGGDLWDDTVDWDYTAAAQWWADSLDVPFYAGIGNHDFDGFISIGDTPPLGQTYFYEDSTGVPLCWKDCTTRFQASFPEADRYGNYVVDLDSARVMFINDNIDTTINTIYKYAPCNPPGHTHLNPGTVPDYSGLLNPTSPTRTAIRDSMATSPMPMIIAVMHRGVVGPHVTVRPNCCRLLDAGGLIDDLQAGGADLVLSGDEHVVYVSKAYRGMQFMGTVAGASSRPLAYTYPDFLSAGFYDYVQGVTIASKDVVYIKMTFIESTLDSIEVWWITGALATAKLYDSN